MRSFNKPGEGALKVQPKEFGNSQIKETFQDLALSVNLQYEEPVTQTRFLGEFKNIGSGYYSIGVPFLMRDQRLYRGKIEQPLFQHQVTLSSYFERTQDRLKPWKNTQTITTSYGGQAGLRFSNLPNLMVNYAPHEERTYQFDYNGQEAGPELYKTNGTNMTLNLGYDYKFLSLPGNINLNFNRHSFSNNQNGENQAIGQYNLANQWSLSRQAIIQASIQAMAGYLQSTGSQHRRRATYEVGGNKTFFGKWRNQINFGLSREASSNTLKETGNEKAHVNQGYSLAYQSMLPLWKTFQLSLRIAKKQIPYSPVYPYQVDRNYYYGYVTLGFRW